MAHPLKPSFKTELPSVLTILLSIATGLFFYQHLPDQIATHFNFAGQPDAYGSKFFSTLGIPILMIAMYLLFLGLPLIDPKRNRYQEFAHVYNIFRTLILLVLLLIQVTVGVYNLGYKIAIGTIIPLFIGLLMIVLGSLMKKIKPNWFIGIRTPWTLSSETVWAKTHKVGGYLFVLFGVVIIIAPFLPSNIAIVLFIIGILSLVFGTIVYSYLLYRKEQKLKK